MAEQVRRGSTGRPNRPQSSRGERSSVGGLVGAGPSIVGISGALRARDVSRPDEVHDEVAEESIVIRRREPVVADTTPRPTAPPRAPRPPVQT